MDRALTERRTIDPFHWPAAGLPAWLSGVSLKFRLIGAYRLVSVVLTSLAYLMLTPGGLLPYKLPVVCALALTAWLILAFYVTREHDHIGLALALTVETVGIALLLVPTGGMSSPFLWYALNPALVAACMLPWWVSWADLAMLLAISSLPWLQGPVADAGSYGNRALVLALCVLALQLMAVLLRRRESDAAALRLQKAELDRANGRLIETVERLTSLHQAVVLLTSQNGGNAGLFAGHAAGLCGGAAFYRGVPGVDEMASAGVALDLAVLAGLQTPEEPSAIELGGRVFLAAPVRHGDGTGLLAIEITGGTGQDDQTRGLLTFLCGLYALVLDRQRAHRSEERLAVMREQNRIAGEIHDSVCQRLFSIACSAHGIAINLTRQNPAETARELKMLEECAGAANRELRGCIYHLRDAAGPDFLREAGEYLREFGRLNGLQVNTTLEGEGELTPGQTDALRRILREACGNAVRHGRCARLSVVLTAGASGARLTVSDDGIGFDRAAATLGMGLIGMACTAREAGGVCAIESKPDRGTVVTATLPARREGLL